MNVAPIVAALLGELVKSGKSREQAAREIAQATGYDAGQDEAIRELARQLETVKAEVRALSRQVRARGGK